MKVIHQYLPHEVSDADSFQDYDTYLSAEVFLSQYGEYIQAERVIKRALENQNSVLDTCMYDVVFFDGAVR